MDPYVLIEYLGNKIKTKTHTDGGKNPVWNQQIDISVGSLQDDMRLTVMDDNTMGDDPIAYCNLKLSSLCINGGVSDHFSLTWKDRKAGTLTLHTIFKAKGAKGAQKTEGGATQQPAQ